MATADLSDHLRSDIQDGDSLAGEKRTAKGREKSRLMADKSQKEDAVPVEFNLSDPDQLSRQLERVDLTEEESDELLREAYKVNKQLRMMLKQKQDNIAASLRSQSADSSVSPKAGTTVLPPIKNKGAGGIPQRSLKAYGQDSPKNASSAGKSQAKSAKSRSTAQRPTWDDRFSYS